MSPKALVILASGCEEIETSSIIDVLARGGVEVVIASLGCKSEPIPASRGVTFLADYSLNHVINDDYQAIVLPGGESGSKHLAEAPLLKERLEKQQQEGAWIAAICAAPALVLTPFGILTEQMQATCYPSCAELLPSGSYQNKCVVVDLEHHLITSQGPATAIEFAITLLGFLQTPQKAQSVAEDMLFSARA